MQLCQNGYGYACFFSGGNCVRTDMGMHVFRGGNCVRMDMGKVLSNKIITVTDTCLYLKK